MPTPRGLRGHFGAATLTTAFIAIALGVPAITLAATSGDGRAPTSDAATMSGGNGMAAGAMTAAGTRLAVDEAVPDRLPAGGNGRLFRSQCLPSHIAMDDPIVFPNQPGASHEHLFFGNVTTNAASTLTSMQGQPTSCRISEDHAGYWVPTLLQDGRQVPATFVNAYYLADGARGHIVPFPAGLKVIAGNSKATSPQSTAILGWKCANQVATTLSATPTMCPKNTDNVLVIRFPDCWNGHDLDSADHRSHLAYRVGGVCPAGYPVALPRLSLNVHYRLSTLSGLAFSSGSIDTAHADFFNAWNQTVLAGLVERNLN